MNAIEFLIKDHRYQEELLEKLKSSSASEPSKREELYEEFRSELIKHVNIEEEIFYPRIKKIPKLEAKVLEALEEHNICMRLLQEIDCKEADDKLWAAKIAVLKELTAHHLKEEEEELFPEVQEMATEEFLEEMGTQMRYHKKVTDPEKVLYPDK
ncbi:MAG TPA: hemerythrin domain-containing protein [Bacteriovoracaceae bacterium]|nr:hemerythrin domain-containing protein [Bacteriovoracaceae bacterium]